MPTVEKFVHRKFSFCSARVLLLWMGVCLLSCLIYAAIAFASLLNKNILPEDVGLQSIPYGNVPERYRVKLSFFTDSIKSNKTFNGQVALIFTSYRESNRIHIHRGSNIKLNEISLHLEGSSNSISVRKGAYDEETEIQTLILGTNTIIDARYILELKFKGKFVTSNAGMQEFVYETERKEKRYGLYFATNDQAKKGLRYLLPCFDSNQFPAVFDLIIVRKQSLTSLFNSVILKTTRIDSTLMEDHYVSSLKMMPAQFVLVLCDFQFKREVYDGTIISIYSRTEVLSNVSTQQISKFMDPKSKVIGKNDAIVIPYASTMHRPGISIINEEEVIRESGGVGTISEGFSHQNDPSLFNVQPN